MLASIFQFSFSFSSFIFFSENSRDAEKSCKSEVEFTSWPLILAVQASSTIRSLRYNGKLQRSGPERENFYLIRRHLYAYTLYIKREISFLDNTVLNYIRKKKIYY